MSVYYIRIIIIGGFGITEIEPTKDNTEKPLEKMYERVVVAPNNRRFIKCPECGEEILMIPNLKEMNQAIEDHVKLHKALLKNRPLEKQHTAMQIRFSLAEQVLLLKIF